MLADADAVLPPSAASGGTVAELGAETCCSRAYFLAPGPSGIVSSLLRLSLRFDLPLALEALFPASTAPAIFAASCSALSCYGIGRSLRRRPDCISLEPEASLASYNLSRPPAPAPALAGISNSDSIGGGGSYWNRPRKSSPEVFARNDGSIRIRRYMTVFQTCLW